MVMDYMFSRGGYLATTKRMIKNPEGRMRTTSVGVFATTTKEQMHGDRENRQLQKEDGKLRKDVGEEGRAPDGALPFLGL